MRKQLISVNRTHVSGFETYCKLKYQLICVTVLPSQSSVGVTPCAIRKFLSEGLGMADKHRFGLERVRQLRQSERL